MSMDYFKRGKLELGASEYLWNLLLERLLSACLETAQNDVNLQVEEAVCGSLD